MPVHSWHRAFESRGRASAHGNSQEAGQFAGHRSEERRFSSVEPSRGKKQKKDESKMGGQNLIKREDGRLYCIFLANSCFCGNSMFKAANTVTRDNLPSLRLLFSPWTPTKETFLKQLASIHLSWHRFLEFKKFLKNLLHPMNNHVSPLHCASAQGGINLGSWRQHLTTQCSFNNSRACSLFLTLCGKRTKDTNSVVIRLRWHEILYVYSG